MSNTRDKGDGGMVELLVKKVRAAHEAERTLLRSQKEYDDAADEARAAWDALWEYNKDLEEVALEALTHQNQVL